MLTIDGERTTQMLLQSEFLELHPSISQDGRWLAYVSAESGAREVYVRPFPNVDDGKWLVSSTGGDEPVWAPDGNELFYRQQHALFSVSTETEPPFGNPEVLFAGPYLSAGGAGGHTYDVSPDGDRFLMLKVIGEEDGMAEPHINVVLNWFEELERLAPTP